MKAEIAVMTAENIDRKAIARGGEILKKRRACGHFPQRLYTVSEETP